MMKETYFAVSAPGLETYTAQELSQLGLLPAALSKSRSSKISSGAALFDEEGGGIEFSGDRKALYHANLNLRTASRVLVRAGEFFAAAFSELRKKASRLPWENYLKPGQPVAIRATSHKSRLYHTGGIAERVAGAIGDRLGAPVGLEKSVENVEGPPPQLVVVRLLFNQVAVSVDSSGELLHRRGYRLATAKAPLRETLAAGMLIASGWDGASPLLDPFCGSGTIPIEAALIAKGIPPGSHRYFAFMDWPGFDREEWEAVLAESRGSGQSFFPVIYASDRDEGAIRIAQENAARAGMQDAIDFSARAVSAIEPPPGTGWVVTNPPYGQRVRSNKDLRNLYAQLGNVLREKCPGWSIAVMSSDLQLLGNMGLPLDTSLSFVNGGIRVKLARGIVQ